MIIWLIYDWDLKIREATTGPQHDKYLICLEECGTIIKHLKRDTDEEEYEAGAVAGYELEIVHGLRILLSHRIQFMNPAWTK